MSQPSYDELIAKGEIDESRVRPPAPAPAPASALPSAASSRVAMGLEGLTVGDLRKKALAAGVDSDAIEAARDSDTPKDDLIKLIFAASS